MHEYLCDQYSVDEATDMRQVGYSSALRMRHLARVDDLREEPEPDQQASWNECDLYKDEDDQNRLDLIARVHDQKRAHHCGNCSTRTEVGNCGVGVGNHLR